MTRSGKRHRWIGGRYDEAGVKRTIREGVAHLEVERRGDVEPDYSWLDELDGGFGDMPLAFQLTAAEHERRLRRRPR